jgi:hypothetical protein
MLTDARARWDAGDYDPTSGDAQAVLSQITSSDGAAAPPRRTRRRRRLVAALVAAVCAAAITVPGTAPDVIAKAASALRASAGEVLTFTGELSYGTSGETTARGIRVEGTEHGLTGSLFIPGGVPGDLEERRELGHRVPLSQVSLLELRELLERASGGDDDSVDLVGETTVAGREVYELRMQLADDASRTLYVDAESYLPVRLEQTGPGDSWSTLDFTAVERVSEAEWADRQQRPQPPAGVRP